jgi:hypothetical protein
VLPSNAWLKSWVYKLPILILIISLQTAAVSNANVFTNKISEKPRPSTNIEIMLIDTSRSVDKDVVSRGLVSLREKVAKVYEGSGGKYDKPANSYYFWLPILGQNDKKDFYPLFTMFMDEDIWSAVRNTIDGRANEIKTLEKIRGSGGLWRELIMAGNISTCSTYVASRLNTAGLFGKSLKGVSVGLCNEANNARRNYQKMDMTVNNYLSGITSNNGGSDIFGAIAEVNEVMDEALGLKKYKKVKLVFVTDGLNNTNDYALREQLLRPGTDACRLGTKKASDEKKYKPAKVFVKMYGIGEGRGGPNGSGNDILRPTLKKYWTCYWKEKGIKKPEFGQLNQLGVG